MANSTASDLPDRVKNLLHLVGKLADALLEHERKPEEDSLRCVASGWSALSPAVIEARQFLSRCPEPVANWVREVHRVTRWFDSVVRKEGLENVLFQYNCDGLIRISQEGDALFETLADHTDDVAFVDESPTAAADAIGDGFIERLLAGPVDVELGPRQLAFLEAYLQQPLTLQQMANDAQESGRGLLNDHSKLLQIRDYNRNLQRFNSDYVARDTALQPERREVERNPDGNQHDGRATLSGEADAETEPRRLVQSEKDRTKTDLRAFDGGEMVFYADRVELCGVDICSGPRSSSRRIALELLSRKRRDGTFVAYSGKELEKQLIKHGGRGAASGLIRDLRDDIEERLGTQKDIECGRMAVILSGDSGYRFAESEIVRYVDPPVITDITDIDESENVLNVPDDDVRDAFDVPDDAAARRCWILQQLDQKVELKAPMVAEQFKCSAKTAQRSLTALKDEKKIEYVGAPRTGHYRLRQAHGKKQ